MHFEFADVTQVESPFNYLVSPKAFDLKIGETILNWLEKSAPWSLVETDFYEQYEFSFFDQKLPDYLDFLKSKETLQFIQNFIESNFKTHLSKKLDFTAHKLLSGQRIRIHNDYIPGMETHRLLIQLNRGWFDENGGMLMFFNSQDPKDLHKVFRPLNNTAVAFEISPKSHHAVSAINSGERYTLVYSFYKEGHE